jgi:hypothetical protein
LLKNPALHLHLALRAVVVAADEHRWLEAIEVGVDHERVANTTERLHEMSRGSERLSLSMSEAVFTLALFRPPLPAAAPAKRPSGIAKRQSL